MKLIAATQICCVCRLCTSIRPNAASAVLAAAGLRTFGHRLRPVSYLVNLHTIYLCVCVWFPGSVTLFRQNPDFTCCLLYSSCGPPTACIMCSAQYYTSHQLTNQVKYTLCIVLDIYFKFLGSRLVTSKLCGISESWTSSSEPKRY